MGWNLIIGELIILLLIYFFFALMHLIAVLFSDWKGLAAVYPSQEIPEVIQFRMRRVVVDKGFFPLGLNVKVTTSGLNLSSPWIFRFGLPSIHIPWEDLKLIKREKLIIEMVTFEARLRPETYIAIPIEIFYEAEKFLPE